MISWLRWLLARLGGTAALPEEFRGALATDEEVLAVARGEQGPLVATHLGLWVPERDTTRRIRWHLVNKATWNEGVIGVVEAEECGRAGDAVLLRDLPVRRFRLTSAGRLPEVVHARVTSTIRSTHHRRLPGGGARFVQRKVPGQDGIVLHVRADEGTDDAALIAFAREVTEHLRRAKESGQD
jgi:hypothetical protein